MTPPKYFEAVRSAAAARWDQLEADPELAGPWHQLFRQVQSPRHVLSELLQNADDAGATEASVSLDQSTFLFEHNGEDFAEDHFRSLCRFGYSNKRTLHTIGFRGIGFKSTFSLGETVELFSPSLAVKFHQSRFTEPVWINSATRPDGSTRVRVAITDTNRLREIEKNLEDWRNHPLALLFFRNLRALTVCGQEMKWIPTGAGPSPKSEWFEFGGEKQVRHLVVRSEEEPFPDEVLEEIRKERSLSASEEIDLPPCRVELVLGAAGRLHVVLPTGVKTDLPFACNAPFIQDPARMKIKDPETSPTNRWLLERIGRLAADALKRWLADESRSRGERADAYELMPDVDRDDSSLEGACASAVEISFADAIEGEAIVLNCTETLVGENECSQMPAALFEVWDEETLGRIFDPQGRAPLAPEIGKADREKLQNWGLISSINRKDVAATLLNHAPPKPSDWARLLKLWAYIAPEIRATENPQHHLVPTQGSDSLTRASTLVRLRKVNPLTSDDDWRFITSFLETVDPEWIQFLEDGKTEGNAQGSSRQGGTIREALDVLGSLGLSTGSSAETVIEQVAKAFFSRSSVTVIDAVRLSQIAARLEAKVGESFRYFVTGSDLKRSGELLVDVDGTLEPLLPPNRRQSELLHPDYSVFSSCSAGEWEKWVRSGNAGLLTFPRMGRFLDTYFRSETAVVEELRLRGYKNDIFSRYSSPGFQLVDWDFDQDLLSHWEEVAVDMPDVWFTVVQGILFQIPNKDFWVKPALKSEYEWQHRRHRGRNAMSALAFEVSHNGHENCLVNLGICPSWALRLRDQPCLLDTRGALRKPSDLLRRNAATEAFIDVEPFLNHALDNDSFRPILDLLGVRDVPLGPVSILSRLRALSKAEFPPLEEVDKWYRRLDQIVSHGTRGDREILRNAFAGEKLILTASGTWSVSAGVFVSASEDDVPGAAVIRPSVAGLDLWSSIGVAERPTADLAIEWLKSLPSGELLAKSDAPRVRSLLGQFALRVWNECAHWVNLSGQWVPVEALSHSITMGSLITWKHLFPAIKEATADFQMVSSAITGSPPFASLPSLASQLENRPGGVPSESGSGDFLPWLAEVACALMRVKLDSGKNQERVRALAGKLAETRLRRAPRLTLTPYLDSVPAGQSVDADVVWIGHVIFIRQMSEARMAQIIPDEIGRPFDSPEIQRSLAYSYDRSTASISAYFEENFDLDPDGEEPNHEISDAPQPDEGEAPIIDGASLPITPNFEDAGAPSDTDSHKNETGQVSEPGGDSEKKQPSKPSQPDLMERFAAMHGFVPLGENRFRHADGSTLEKVMNFIAPWERRDSAGNVVRRYWSKNLCLERDVLELPAELWKFLEKNPTTVSLILTNPGGHPIEVSGDRLIRRVAAEEVTLYPATYRLVCRAD